MDSLRLGELLLDAEPSGIGFTWHDDSEQRVVVPKHKIGALIAFLGEHCPEERRTGFRVPLRPLSDEIRDAFAVTVAAAGRKVPATPVDLSLTGILVDVPEAKLRAGQDTTVTLCLYDDCVSLAAKVVRCDHDLAALHFPSCVKEGDLDPPDSLLSIYRTLELDWLRTRNPT